MAKREPSTKAQQSRYRSLAKRADQRMREIENYIDKGNELYQRMGHWAYAKAQYNIESMFGSESAKINAFGKYVFRFDKSIKNMSEREAAAAIKKVETFLQSPTSTARGVNKMYKAKADAINRRYGTKLDWQSIANYYQDGRAEDMSIGSDDVFRIIAEWRDDKATKERWMQRFKESDTRGRRGSDKQVQNWILDNITSLNISINDLR